LLVYVAASDYTKTLNDVDIHWRILMDDKVNKTEASANAEDKSSEAALPGSWVESGASDGTQILSSISAEDLKGLTSPAANPKPKPASASSAETPQLIAYGEDDEEQAFDLPTTDGPDPDIWVIGRNASCEISLNDPSVSSRHAQLIHQGGRWKIVSLVSTNGLFINGDKKLTAYLGNGDDIIIGSSHLAFSLGAASTSTENKPKKKGFLQRFMDKFK
jgi:hypothetical protein